MQRTLALALPEKWLPTQRPFPPTKMDFTEHTFRTLPYACFPSVLVLALHSLLCHHVITRSSLAKMKHSELRTLSKLSENRFAIKVSTPRFKRLQNSAMAFRAFSTSARRSLKIGLLPADGIGREVLPVYSVAFECYEHSRSVFCSPRETRFWPWGRLSRRPSSSTWTLGLNTSRGMERLCPRKPCGGQDLFLGLDECLEYPRGIQGFEGRVRLCTLWCR